MGIMRSTNGRRGHGDRVVSDYHGYANLEAEVVNDIEYAWNWPVAQALAEAFGKEFDREIKLKAAYQKGLLGSCRHCSGKLKRIVLRPTMRGNEAWKTFIHELAHAITEMGLPDHGEEFQKNLGVVHTFWMEFLKTASEGELRDDVIGMVTGYAKWRGRQIGFNETTDPWKRPREDRPQSTFDARHS